MRSCIAAVVVVLAAPGCGGGGESPGAAAPAAGPESATEAEPGTEPEAAPERETAEAEAGDETPSPEEPSLSGLLGLSREEIALHRAETRERGSRVHYGPDLSIGYRDGRAASLRIIMERPFARCGDACRYLGYDSPGPSQRGREGQSMCDCQADPRIGAEVRARLMRLYLTR